MKQVKKRGVRLPKINANTMQLLCICLVIFAVFSFLKPSRFPTLRNLESMCFQMPEPGLFTLGIAITMLTAGADLSIVAVANLVATLCGLMLLNVMPQDAAGAEAVMYVALCFVIAVGVGLFLVLAFLRIYFKIRLSTLLMILYGLLLAVSFFAPSEFVPVAFDSGGVTTGPMTVPFIMTLGVGFCAVRTDRDSANDSFGLIALCSIGPILMVLLLSIFYHPEEATYEAAKLTPILSTHDMVREFLYSLPHYAKEVCLSILPTL